MFRCGYVSIAGKPNVGKSTLLNSLLGEKLSIVSPKPQTTRKTIKGILTGKDYQIIFQDCPGLTEREDLLNEFLRSEIERALDDSDILLYLVDASKPEKPQKILDRLPSEKRIPYILAINKMDLVGKKRLEELLEEYKKPGIFDEVLAVSSLKGEGLDRLLESLVSYLPERPPLYDEDYITDLPVRFLASEIIREKLFLFLREEVPYSAYVSIEEFDEREDLVYIDAIIYVERESQKGIVIGKGGEMIKKISTEARKDIEALLGSKVYLDLRVKVHKKWSKKKGFFIRYKRELLS